MIRRLKTWNGPFPGEHLNFPGGKWILREGSLHAWLFQHHIQFGWFETGLSAGLLYWHKLKRDLQRSSCLLGLSGYEPKLTTLLRPELWRPEGHPQWDLWWILFGRLERGMKLPCKAHDRLTHQFLQVMKRSWIMCWRAELRCKWILGKRHLWWRREVGPERDKVVMGLVESGLALQQVGKTVDLKGNSEAARGQWNKSCRKGQKVRCLLMMEVNHSLVVQSLRRMGFREHLRRKWWKDYTKRMSNWNSRWNSWRGFRQWRKVELQLRHGRRFQFLEREYHLHPRGQGALHVDVCKSRRKSSHLRVQEFRIHRHQVMMLLYLLFPHGHGERMAMRRVRWMAHVRDHGVPAWEVECDIYHEKDVQDNNVIGKTRIGHFEVEIGVMSKEMYFHVMENLMKWWMQQQPEQSGWDKSWWHFSYKWREMQGDQAVSCRLIIGNNQ